MGGNAGPEQASDRSKGGAAGSLFTGLAEGCMRAGRQAGKKGDLQVETPIRVLARLGQVAAGILASTHLATELVCWRFRREENARNQSQAGVSCLAEEHS
mmetsp:Transcript_80364/g.176163  ORF Transcript_80364/g.176163 Transcript_80364/m.176163 type:complete len:100 (+) Transcript_80364:115-414(+)